MKKLRNKINYPEANGQGIRESFLVAVSGREFIQKRLKSLVSESGIAIMNLHSILIKLFIILLIIPSFTSVHAQSVIELDGYFEQMKASSDPVLKSEATHLESLIKDLHSTVHVGGIIRLNGEAQPICATVNVDAFDQLSLENPLFSQVELITIRLKSLDDMSFILDLTKLTGFIKLKYVYFLCEFNGGIENIPKLILHKTGVTVFYKVSIPS